MANHISSGVWLAPAHGQSAQSWPLQLLQLEGDCIPPISIEILWAWEYNPELTAVDEYIYLLCLKWPSSYTLKIGAGVRRQLVHVVGTGGLSPRPVRRGLLLHGSLGWLWGHCGWSLTSLLTKELDQPSFAAVGGGAFPHTNKQFSDTSWVFYNSTHFWHYLSENSVRS